MAFPSETDSEESKTDPDVFEAITARICLACGTDLDEREQHDIDRCVPIPFLQDWLRRRMPRDEAIAILTSLLRDLRHPKS